MSVDPRDARQRDERRLTGLKIGAVGLTVAGLGVFAGLAAAGTDDGPTAPATSSPEAAGSVMDAARSAADDSFFDDEAQQGAVGGYEGYEDHGDYGGHDGGAAPEGYAPSQGSTGAS